MHVLTARAPDALQLDMVTTRRLEVRSPHSCHERGVNAAEACVVPLELRGDLLRAVLVGQWRQVVGFECTPLASGHYLLEVAERQPAEHIRTQLASRGAARDSLASG